MSAEIGRGGAVSLARYERGWTGSMLDVWAEDAQSEIDRLRAEVEALLSVLIRARRGIAWASQQRPELIEDYEAVDAAIAARNGEGSEG